jgi:hypothetical protein
MRDGGPGRFARWLLLWCAGVGLLVPTLAPAIPPPPARSELVLDLHADGGTRVIEDEVRAYQAVSLTFHANAGDELLVWLADSERLLVLDVEAPSDLRWVSGAVPGPDGLRLRLIETGVHRMYVVMTGDAARVGKAARFQLRLKLHR